MNKFTQTLLLVLVSLTLILGATNLIYLKNNNKPRAIGSSVDAQGYYSTSTDATWNTTTFPTQFKLLKSTSGILGSVVITGATTATVLNFYDATTTSLHSNFATTTIGKINTSSPAGTYTFDVAFSQGLVVEFPSAIGAASSTITWK